MKFLIIDGFNVIRRIYEARRDEANLDKRIEGTLTAALKSISRALRDHSPTHAVLVLDAEGTNWRHDLFPPYKAGRTPMEPKLREAILEWVKTEVYPKLGLPSVWLSGFEADDLIARLHSDWRILVGEGEEFPCVVLSTDKDTLSLIEPGTIVYHHFDQASRNEAWVVENLGVAPAQVLDYLALMGDSSDNVPGVSKIGPKTAAGLLAQFGTLDQVLANAASIKGKTGERLVEEAHLARLSRQLVSFQCSEQLSLCIQDCRLAAA